jgi:hypothetical protein
MVSTGICNYIPVDAFHRHLNLYEQVHIYFPLVVLVYQQPLPITGKYCIYNLTKLSCRELLLLLGMGGEEVPDHLSGNSRKCIR